MFVLNAWLMIAPLPVANPVGAPAKIAAVHVYVVPVTAFGLVMATLLVWPEQMVCVVAAASGIAFTVTVAITGTPGQPAAPTTGVMVYVAVPPALLLAVNVWMMGPLTGTPNVPPLLAPVTLLCTTVQKYCVPVTVFGLVNKIFVAVALQITWLLAAAVGTGLTIISTVIAVPAHPFALGVMV